MAAVAPRPRPCPPARPTAWATRRPVPEAVAGRHASSTHYFYLAFKDAPPPMVARVEFCLFSFRSLPAGTCSPAEDNSPPKSDLVFLVRLILALF